MEKELKVKEFDKKQQLLDYVNTNSEKLNILSISTSQVSLNYNHFLWFYDK